jgi:hypothetical protein
MDMLVSDPWALPTAIEFHTCGVNTFVLLRALNHHSHSIVLGGFELMS